MVINPVVKFLILGGVLILVGACDGSGSRHGSSRPFPVVTSGQITQMTGDTLTVRGYIFQAAQSQISVRGKTGTLSDLSNGMVVTIKGSVSLKDNSGVAQSIDYQTLAAGPVTAVFADEERFTLLDQNIWVSEITVFQDTTLDTLAIGDVLEISGFIADNEIQAAYIRKTGDLPGQDTLISGVISGLDPDAMTFHIGNLAVDYSAAQLGKQPAGGLQNGLLVTVTGRRLGDWLMAGKITVLASLGGATTAGDGPYPGHDNLSFDAGAGTGTGTGNNTGLDQGAGYSPATGTGSGTIGASGGGTAATPAPSGPVPETLSLDGLIQALYTDGSLLINGTLIYRDDATAINAGATGDLRVGDFVTLRASRAADGTWIADSIDVPPVTTITLDALLTAIDPDTLTFTGNGMTFRISDTVLVTSEDPAIGAGALSDLYSGAPLRLSGYLDDGGNLVVTRIILLPAVAAGGEEPIADSGDEAFPAAPHAAAAAHDDQGHESMAEHPGQSDHPHNHEITGETTMGGPGHSDSFRH